MRVKPLLVAMDCDDTLLTDELIVPDSAIEAIAAARAQGVRVVLATGRMYSSVLPHAKSAGVDDPVIAYNGALVRNINGTTVTHTPVPLPRVYELIQLAEEHNLALNLYVNDTLYTRTWDERSEYYVSIAEVEAHVVPDLRSICTEGSTKVLIVDKPEVAATWLQRLQQHYGSRLAISRSKPRFVEIMAPGISKATALSALANSLGIPQAAVMAIGDSLNDLEMLQYAGIGVAVGNAAPEVKSQVDYVTARNEEGGIAEAIHKFVLD